MNSDIEQTVYLLGMLSGLQAMTNDINSGGAVQVPKDIAAVVERGMTCLDNTKFWGAPNATRAVIWTLLPGAGDENLILTKLWNSQYKLVSKKVYVYHMPYML